MTKNIWHLLTGKSPQNQITIHGSARFLAKEEQSQVLSRWNKGFIVDGKHKRVSEKTAFVHCCILAPTGAGKTSSFFYVNALRPGKGSKVFIDTNGELLQNTASYLKKKGYNIMVLDLSLEGMQAEQFSYNPIEYLKTGTDSSIRKFAKILIESGDVSSNDAFWTNSAIDVLCLLLKVLLQQPEEKQNLYGLYQLVQLFTADVEQMAALCADGLDDGDFLKFQAYQNYSDKMRNSILGTASIALSSLSDTRIQELTASNSLGNLKALRSQRTVLYMVIPESNVAHIKFLLSLFVKDLIDVLMVKPKKQEHSVYLYLDEFANLYLPDVVPVFTTIRKYRVSIIIAIQSIMQLREIYGANQAQTLLDNCLSKIVLSGLSGDSSRAVSDLLGKATIVFEPSEGQVQYLPRMLMTPSEIRTLARDEALFIHGNLLPIKLNVTPWFQQFGLLYRVHHYKSKP